MRWPSSSSCWSSAALAEGWAVSVPDHEGTDGIWGAPREPGYHILDGLRAALNFEPLGLSPEAPIGLWGYSGGGLATAWAAEMYADYAPELNVVGAVLGSPVADLGSAYRRLNGSIYSGLPAMVVAALSHVYPDLDRVIAEHATPDGKKMLQRIEKMTTAHAVLSADPQGHGRPRRLAAAADPRHTRGAARLREHQARHHGAHPAGADRAGGARQDRVRRRHRRADRDLLAAAAPTSPTTATCSASTCCCIRCRRP